MVTLAPEFLTVLVYLLSRASASDSMNISCLWSIAEMVLGAKHLFLHDVASSGFLKIIAANGIHPAGWDRIQAIYSRASAKPSSAIFASIAGELFGLDQFVMALGGPPTRQCMHCNLTLWAGNSAVVVTKIGALHAAPDDLAFVRAIMHGVEKSYPRYLQLW
ncbi:hypothetical protein BC828DRAFT_410007 [Blastocladiella britannica]|nr:hypothetical protein BC828DRAFT_410007 [Blastocladiella britannica]